MNSKAWCARADFSGERKREKREEDRERKERERDRGEERTIFLFQCTNTPFHLIIVNQQNGFFEPRIIVWYYVYNYYARCILNCVFRPALFVYVEGESEIYIYSLSPSLFLCISLLKSPIPIHN
jgi:hypothetical protein